MSVNNFIYTNKNGVLLFEVVLRKFHVKLGITQYV